MDKTNKITIRVTNRQLQDINELKDKLGCSYSLMIRTIISDFLTKNEERLEAILTKDTEWEGMTFEEED